MDGGVGADTADLQNRVVFFYSARAAHDASCPNLHDPSRFEAQVLAEAFSTQVRWRKGRGGRELWMRKENLFFFTQDVKDVVNCIGGVQALFPLLETAAASSDEDATDTGYLSLRDESSDSIKDR